MTFYLNILVFFVVCNAVHVPWTGRAAASSPPCPWLITRSIFTRSDNERLWPAGGGWGMKLM